MGFNLESRKNKEINETPEAKIDSDHLSETEETAENFDDCSLQETQDSKGNEVNAESLEDAEDNYDDCEAKMEELEEKNPELADDEDSFDDCGKETDGQYVAEVTYTTDGEISKEEASAEVQEAYNECDDPEDMQQLKENASENEHIEVHTAEVVERPENAEMGEEVTEEEYEEAQEELEEAQENLEAQQEAAQEYQEDLENQINNRKDNVSEETENINNEAAEDVEDSEEAEEAAEESEVSAEAEETAEDTEDITEAEKAAEDTEDTAEAEEAAEDTEDTAETEEAAEDTEDTAEAEEAAEDTDGTAEVEEATDDAEFSDQVGETSSDTADSDEVEVTAEDTEDTAETEEAAEDTDGTAETEEAAEDTDGTAETEEAAEDAIPGEGEALDADALEGMDDASKVDVSEINEDALREDVSEQVEADADTELSDEAKAQISEEISDEVDSRSESDKISVAEVEEIVEEKKDDAVDALEEQSESLDDEIDQNAEQIAENGELTPEEAKEQIADKVSDSARETLSDDDAEAAVEEKSEAIDEAIAEKEEAQKSVDAVEETADELKEEQTEQCREQSLQERIDSAFEKEDVTASEISSLRDEHSAELQAKIDEKNAIEATLKSKFDEVLSKEAGSDEYRQALREYNALQDQKSELTDQIAAMEKQQDLLENKRVELRQAQIQKGSEAVAASAATLAGVDALQERYDQTYYESHPDKAELANIREESCSAIRELTDEKESIKRAMDAKMDEIAEYVVSGNMDRYDTAHDLRYQQLSAEYTAMKERYDKIGYAIVKLDENNKAISEHLGDAYVSMVELPPRSRISEVNNGTDVPGETNYFIDETKAAEVLSPFKQSSWEQLTVQEQKQAVKRLADYNAEILGVEDKPRIIYYRAEDPCDFGGYSAKQNAIYINEYNMHDAAETADTISHEYRHKYQHERAEKLETERDLAFKEGFDNYIRAEDDYQGYKEQLVEADARAYAQVIQDQIDSTSASEAADTKPPADTDGPHTTFEDLNPKKGAVWDVPPRIENYKAIEQPVPDSHETAPPSLEHRGFLTNDGERITYEEAVNRITQNAEKYMSSLNVGDDIKAAVVADMRAELYKQHLEAESRGLGDHGIRHIYGNFERGEKYLASRSDISDEQKLAVLVAQVYHDEGYTVSPNNQGTLHGGDASAHDRASAEIWSEPARQNIYKQVFTEKTLGSIDVAIGKHNSDKIDDIQANTSIEADPVVSTVHVCDKLALSQREKFSELLASDPKLVELTESMNATLKILQDERLGFYEGGKLTSRGEKLLQDYHQVINAHIDSQGYDAEYATRLKDAVQKDVGFNSGKFSSRMNYIYTPSDCYQHNSETGRNEITVFVIEHSDGESSDLAYKQVDKLLGDLGLSASEIELAKANGGYDFGAERGLSVRIEPIKEDDIRQLEANRFQENNDLKEINECIEAGRKDYKKLSQEFAEIAAITNGQDLSYNTYCEVAFSANVVVDFTEQEFKTYSPAEKEQLVQDVVSKMVLTHTSNILVKQKG